MTKTPTQLKDLAVGDLIYTEILVNVADIASVAASTKTEIMYTEVNVWEMLTD